MLKRVFAEPSEPVEDATGTPVPVGAPKTIKALYDLLLERDARIEALLTAAATDRKNINRLAAQIATLAPQASKCTCTYDGHREALAKAHKLAGDQVASIATEKMKSMEVKLQEGIAAATTKAAETIQKTVDRSVRTAVGRVENRVTEAQAMAKSAQSGAHKAQNAVHQQTQALAVRDTAADKWTTVTRNKKPLPPQKEATAAAIKAAMAEFTKVIYVPFIKTRKTEEIKRLGDDIERAHGLKRGDFAISESRSGKSLRLALKKTPEVEMSSWLEKVRVGLRQLDATTWQHGIYRVPTATTAEEIASVLKEDYDVEVTTTPRLLFTYDEERDKDQIFKVSFKSKADYDRCVRLAVHHQACYIHTYRPLSPAKRRERAAKAKAIREQANRVSQSTQQ